MQDLFINFFGWSILKSPLLKFFRIDSVFRFLIKRSANFILPFYFILTKNNSNIKVNVKSTKKQLVIVSYTTSPARIDKIWLVVECILRQETKPDKLLLWLSKEQFPSKEKLPKSLLDLEKRGLDIILCDEDLRSHKKYYYTLINYPEDIMITIDDDFFYPSYLLTDLLKLHKKNPNVICSERAHLMKVENGSLSTYGKWEFLYKGHGPSFEIFQTSGGGTLYPPGSLHPEVLNKEIFLKYCKTADDVWLNIMSQLNSTQIIKSDNYFEPIPLISKHDINLSTVNVVDGQNDIQIKNVRNLLVEKLGIDPFHNLLSNK